MSEAFAWGAIAASSLLVGSLIVMWRPVRQDTLGLIMAFGAGVLISAVAYELVAEALQTGDEFAPVAAGLASGALAFYRLGPANHPRHRPRRHPGVGHDRPDTARGRGR